MLKEWNREFNSTATVLVLLSANGTGGCLTGFEWNRPSVDVPPPGRKVCQKIDHSETKPTGAQSRQGLRRWARLEKDVVADAGMLTDLVAGRR